MLPLLWILAVYLGRSIFPLRNLMSASKTWNEMNSQTRQYNASINVWNRDASLDNENGHCALYTSNWQSNLTTNACLVKGNHEHKPYKSIMSHLNLHKTTCRFRFTDSKSFPISWPMNANETSHCENWRALRHTRKYITIRYLIRHNPAYHKSNRTHLI